MTRTYTIPAILTQADLDQIAVMYQYNIPIKIIGQSFNLGYQKISQLIQVIKVSHQIHSPSKIREDITGISQCDHVYNDVYQTSTNPVCTKCGATK